MSTPPSSTSSSSPTPSTPPPPSQPSSSATTPSPSRTPLRPLLYTLLLACPLLALLPPRKLDLYTFSLTGAWVLSAEELAFGGARRVGNTGVMGVLGGGRMEGSADVGVREGADVGVRDGKGEGEGEGEDVRGLARRLWMGGEGPGWQKRRLEREREELEGGKGYGDIIMGQVREVFPGFGEGDR